MRFTVTKGDILRGVKNSPVMCPVARAIRRILKRSEIRVGIIIFIDEYTFGTPPNVLKFMKKFDALEDKEILKMRQILFELPIEER